ncbi:MAG: hypothetical protein HOP19_00120 [Acidobacteria bacterium]|nr:hypothetical protein [Acidobacteriota bacterium]
MTHVIHQSTLQCLRVTLGGLLLAVAAFALFQFTTAPVAATQGAAAQPTATPPRYTVRITHVKMGMTAEFEALVKNEMLPAYKKGGLKQAMAWVSASLGEAAEYVTLRPYDGAKQFDEPGALTKALGEEGARALTRKWSLLVNDTRQFVVQMKPELSIPPKNNDAPKLAVVYRTKIAPFRTLEYEEHFKAHTLPWISKASQKAYLMSKVGMGGDSNEYFGAFWVDSYTDMSKWSASFPTGGSGAGQKLAGIVLSQESAIYRYVPELSIRPEAQKAAK